jgi:hypothetical protein
VEFAPALNNLAAGLTLGFGALGLFAPDTAARLVALSPVGLRGRSEIRALHGGVFLGLGCSALLFQDRVGFALLGAAWLGAALARLYSIWRDGARESANWRAVAIESVLAVLALARS